MTSETPQTSKKFIGGLIGAFILATTTLTAGAIHGALKMEPCMSETFDNAGRVVTDKDRADCFNRANQNHELDNLMGRYSTVSGVMLAVGGIAGWNIAGRRRSVMKP